MTANPRQDPTHSAAGLAHDVAFGACRPALWRTHDELACPARGRRCATGRCRMHGGASTGPRTPEGLQRIVKARTVHGRYGAEMRELRRLMRLLDEEQRRVLELVK